MKKRLQNRCVVRSATADEGGAGRNSAGLSRKVVGFKATRATSFDPKNLMEAVVERSNMMRQCKKARIP